MCGIAGIFGAGERATVEAMLGTLTHRGPDDQFQVGGEDFTIGARRLSIVDVAGGRQPMSDETGRIWACQNGELYNYPQMRPRLLAGGHALHTHCDTELLPHLYEEYGTELPRHIDGMFAVAIWDDVRKQGLLARDRMGKKPLYYHASGDRLYFASEIKALLAVPGFRRELNLEALHHYLSLKHVPQPLSIFKGIAVVPPAHQVLFRPGRPPALHRYWDLNFDGNTLLDISEDEAADEILKLLRQGIERRLMSDVPIGFFLSGGLDSSLSTAIAAELSPGRIKTFTLTYQEDATTPGKEADRRWAGWVADRYATDHHEETITFARFPDMIPEILRCFDEPFAGVMSSYFLSALIRQHVKVAISGDGADEMFGSYLSHRLAQPMANLPAYLRTGDSALIPGFETRVDYLRQLAEQAPDDWMWRSKLAVFSEGDKRALYAPGTAAALVDTTTVNWFRDAFAAVTANDPVNRMLEAEFRTVFPDQVLTYSDRLSMAHSLEVRTAYLDTDLVTFVARLPGSMKIKNGTTKHLLKRVARRFFPAEMVDRPKEGFLLPVTQWFQNDLQSYVKETLSPARLSLHGLFQPAAVEGLIQRLYAPNSDYHDVNRVLSLVVFQEWFEIYLA